MAGGEPRGQRPQPGRTHPTPPATIPTLIPPEDTLPPIERFRWLDAMHQDEQQKVEDVDDIVPITSIGYLVRETPWAVTIAAEYVGGGEYRMWGVIPICLIVERERLK